MVPYVPINGFTNVSFKTLPTNKTDKSNTISVTHKSEGPRNLAALKFRTGLSDKIGVLHIHALLKMCKLGTSQDL